MIRGQHHSVKLSPPQIRAVVKQLASGASPKVVAAEYGIDASTALNYAYKAGLSPQMLRALRRKKAPSARSNS